MPNDFDWEDFVNAALGAAEMMLMSPKEKRLVAAMANSSMEDLLLEEITDDMIVA